MILLALLTVPLLDAGPASALPPAAPAGSPVRSALVHSGGPQQPRSDAPLPGALLPGSVSAHEAFIDGAALALHMWQRSQALSAAADSAALANASPPGNVPPRPGPNAPSVRPAAANGTVTGRVIDSIYGRPVVGALVYLLPVGLTSCSPFPCQNVSTDSAGAFSLAGPPGTVAVVMDAPYYISNRTWATLRSGLTVNLGILYLIHDGYATGTVDDTMPGPQPIANVSITATSRDGSVGTHPGAVTGTNGTFTVAVPPLPSQLQFTSTGNPPRYLENFTDVNVTPYQTVNLGVIHLEGGVPVTAHFVDQVTHRFVSDPTPVQLTVCTRRAGYCLPEVLHQYGGNVTGFALAGPSYIKAYAIGYVDNFTPVEDIPSSRSAVDLGTIYLTPLAVVELSVNVTGGPLPSGPWNLSSAQIIACSLDDVEATFQIATNSSLLSSPCTPRGVQYSFVPDNLVSVGGTALIVAPPLRDVLFIAGVGGIFPIPFNALTSLTPLFPAFYANETWVNSTPDRITQAGSFDLTPGWMLSGNITYANGTPASNFGVSVCSTDVNTLCTAGAGAAYAGCPTNPGSFCVPAPEGPVVVTVTGPGAALANRTWVEVPRGCCAQDGHPMDIGWVNLTATPDAGGSVHGTVLGQTGPPGSVAVPIPSILLTVQACPVGPDLVGLPPAPCTNGVVDNATGSFNFSAPFGWDRISVAAPAYQLNWSWIDVTGNNSTGVIELAPDALLVGQVVDTTGHGVYSADVQACYAGDPTNCPAAFATNTFGQFNGTLRGGPLPWGTYEVIASAPGYASDWTWVNTTPGSVSIVPTIVLYAVGSGAARTPMARAAAGTAVGAWVDGRVVDSLTGYGVPNAVVYECTLIGTNCSGMLALTTAGGTFNVSLQLGLYYLQVSATDYPVATVYVNVTGTTIVHLGAITIRHDPWISGRVLISPWSSLADTVGLGAPVEASGCDVNLSRCDLIAPSSTDGSFNVSIPWGPRSTLLLVGRGIAGFGSAINGFDPVRIPVDANAPFLSTPVSGPGAPALSIFGYVTGNLYDGSTFNATLGAATQFCAFCSAVVTAVNSNLAGYVAFQTGGGGNYTAFLPDDGNATQISGTASAYWAAATTVPGALAPGTGHVVPPTDPIHFGWVTMQVVSANGSLPLPYALVNVAAPDPPNGTAYYSNTIDRGDGFVNVTAGFGPSVSVTVLSPGYFPRNFTVSVRPSGTTSLGLVALNGGAPPTVIWINSTAQNTVGLPPTATVVDALTQAALPGAEVIASNAAGSSSTPVLTNGLGQFLFWDAVAPSLTVQIGFTGYSPLTLAYNTTGRYQLTVNRSLMVGDGVVAGRVIAAPGNTPVYDALVYVCPFGNACNNFGYTNATGVFWVEGSRGLETVTVVDDNYLTNFSVTLSVGTDTFQWIGDFPIYAFAGIHGRVFGIPSGDPLVGANVSVCSPFGSPSGPCSYYVPTDANGSYYLPTPPGVYILRFAQPDYNTTYLGVTVYPGENVSLGTMFLFQDGGILGATVSAVTGAPVPNATLLACSVIGGGYCSEPTNATAAGVFLVTAPPGLDILTALAPGYYNNISRVLVPSGGTVAIPPVRLVPVAADLPESVAGTVRSNTTGVPLSGAFVAALQNGVTVASTSTGTDGSYRLGVTWGAYTIVASAPGYVAGRVGVVAHANLTGVDLALAVQTYAVTGTIAAAGFGTLIGGVQVVNGGSLLGTSASDGRYAFSLPNGSYSLETQAPVGGALSFGNIGFHVTIVGGPVVEDLTLPLLSATVDGTVVDALSGLPIVGATVSAIVPPSPSPVATLVVGASGDFTLTLGPGSFQVTASATGYASETVGVLVPNDSAPLVLALSPLATAGPGSPPVDYLPFAAVGVVVAAVVGVVLWRRRTPPPPEPRRWTLDEDEVPLVPAADVPTEAESPVEGLRSRRGSPA